MSCNSIGSSGALSACVFSAVLVLAMLLGGCGDPSTEKQTTIRFWGMGREGEVVEELIHDFERDNPKIRVLVQQIPWTVAHEKLLTAFVGRATPDLAQLGNTWIAEFAALEALEPLDPWLESSNELAAMSYFPGIWDTNLIHDVTYGVPWYVDTRLLFYRKDVLARAGYASMPTTWSEWLEAMQATKRIVGPDNFVVYLPANEWTQPVIFGLQAGSSLLSANATRGAFSEAAFQRAFAFYVDLYRSGLAPPVRDNEIANLYQEFERGYFSMYITGPWNLGEFQRRLPEELQDSWGTAALPGPDGAASGVSLAGGASLVLFRASAHKRETWRLIEFLSQPEQQLRFYKLTGSLPARREAWEDSALVANANTRAFGEQLQRTVSTPKIPEWELIAARLQDHAERAIREQVSPKSALEALDRDVERILEKRRWLLERRGHSAGGRQEEVR